jgi:hypothetical protein
MGKKKDRQFGQTARANGYPYHTMTPEKVDRYHVLTDCPDGKDILEDDIRTGGYGRSLCRECQRLIAERYRSASSRS